MYAAVRVARSASVAQVSRRTFFGASGSKDPVANTFLQELKKLKVWIVFAYYCLSDGRHELQVRGCWPAGCASISFLS
jgi:hypothetical protein